MENRRSSFFALCLIIPLPFVNSIYVILNCDYRPLHSLMTDIDRGIPFLKIFVVPYMGWYAFIICTLVYFCLKDKQTYYKLLFALYLGLFICYGVYYFYQTTVPRPLLVEDDVLTSIVAWLYRTDQPYNCFPSVHSFTSYLMFIGIRNCRVRSKLNQLIISNIAFAIILSTLFIKQHTVLDAISAIFLGELLFDLSNHIYVLNFWFFNQYKNMKSKIGV